MASVIKSVAYSYCEGYPEPFSFDAIFAEGGQITLDIHKKFASKEEFLQELEGVIPIITGNEA